jgi:predicted alpha/beta superfamily hydrolase
MRLITSRVVLLAIIYSISAYLSFAQNSPLTFATQESLDSKVLGEKREILISAPGHPVQGMPLLILLDGEWNMRNVSSAVGHLIANNRLPPMVVAGVVNTDRGRDLMPTFDGDKFAAGPSDRFLSFLADELIPKLSAEYPIGKYHVIAGHSNAGMFSLYAFIRRPEVFQANIALSPSFGLDDHFVAQLAGALAKPVPAPRFVFIGAGGDEEADISVGAMRFAKTFEASPNSDLEYHYEIFPGETHGSVGYRAFYRALEALGQPDAVSHEGPARYLSEPQRRRHAWIRRFGSAFQDDPLPILSVARPMLDELASPDHANLAGFWERLRADYAGDFRFDPLERQNLIQSLESQGRKEDVARVKALAGFDASGLQGNNYGTSVNLGEGLVALLPLKGSVVDLCHPDAKANMRGAIPAPDRLGREGMAYRFNGQGAFIEFPGNSDLSTAGSISVSAWCVHTDPQRTRRGFRRFVRHGDRSGGSVSGRIQRLNGDLRRSQHVGRTTGSMATDCPSTSGFTPPQSSIRRWEYCASTGMAARSKASLALRPGSPARARCSSERSAMTDCISTEMSGRCASTAAH